eukprot:Sspe_Gene.72273::Locus_43097_Transcript_1_1_Confidence_1.000_Length_5918::g.72273::m.72273
MGGGVGTLGTTDHTNTLCLTSASEGGHEVEITVCNLTAPCANPTLTVLSPVGCSTSLRTSYSRASKWDECFLLRVDDQQLKVLFDVKDDQLCSLGVGCVALDLSDSRLTRGIRETVTIKDNQLVLFFRRPRPLLASIEGSGSGSGCQLDDESTALASLPASPAKRPLPADVVWVEMVNWNPDFALDVADIVEHSSGVEEVHRVTAGGATTVLLKLEGRGAPEDAELLCRELRLDTVLTRQYGVRGVGRLPDLGGRRGDDDYGETMKDTEAIGDVQLMQRQIEVLTEHLDRRRGSECLEGGEADEFIPDEPASGGKQLAGTYSEETFAVGTQTAVESGTLYDRTMAVLEAVDLLEKGVVEVGLGQTLKADAPMATHLNDVMSRVLRLRDDHTSRLNTMSTPNDRALEILPPPPSPAVPPPWAPERLYCVEEEDLSELPSWHPRRLYGRPADERREGAEGSRPLGRDQSRIRWRLGAQSALKQVGILDSDSDEVEEEEDEDDDYSGIYGSFRGLEGALSPRHGATSYATATYDSRLVTKRRVMATLGLLRRFTIRMHLHMTWHRLYSWWAGCRARRSLRKVQGAAVGALEQMHKKQVMYRTLAKWHWWPHDDVLEKGGDNGEAHLAQLLRAEREVRKQRRTADRRGASCSIAVKVLDVLGGEGDLCGVHFPPWASTGEVVPVGTFCSVNITSACELRVVVLTPDRVPVGSAYLFDVNDFVSSSLTSKEYRIPVHRDPWHPVGPPLSLNVLLAKGVSPPKHPMYSLAPRDDLTLPVTTRIAAAKQRLETWCCRVTAPYAVEILPSPTVRGDELVHIRASRDVSDAQRCVTVCPADCGASCTVGDIEVRFHRVQPMSAECPRVVVPDETLEFRTYYTLSVPLDCKDDSALPAEVRLERALKREEWRQQFMQHTKPCPSDGDPLLTGPDAVSTLVSSPPSSQGSVCPADEFDPGAAPLVPQSAHLTAHPVHQTSSLTISSETTDIADDPALDYEERLQRALLREEDEITRVTSGNVVPSIVDEPAGGWMAMSVIEAKYVVPHSSWSVSVNLDSHQERRTTVCSTCGERGLVIFSTSFVFDLGRAGPLLRVRIGLHRHDADEPADRIDLFFHTALLPRGLLHIPMRGAEVVIRVEGVLPGGPPPVHPIPRVRSVSFLEGPAEGDDEGRVLHGGVLPGGAVLHEGIVKYQAAHHPMAPQRTGSKGRLSSRPTRKRPVSLASSSVAFLPLDSQPLESLDELSSLISSYNRAPPNMVVGAVLPGGGVLHEGVLPQFSLTSPNIFPTESEDVRSSPTDPLYDTSGHAASSPNSCDVFLGSSTTSVRSFTSPPRKAPRKLLHKSQQPEPLEKNSALCRLYNDYEFDENEGPRTVSSSLQSVSIGAGKTIFHKEGDLSESTLDETMDRSTHMPAWHPDTLYSTHFAPRELPPWHPSRLYPSPPPHVKPPLTLTMAECAQELIRLEGRIVEQETRAREEEISRVACQAEDVVQRYEELLTLFASEGMQPYITPLGEDPHETTAGDEERRPEESKSSSVKSPSSPEHSRPGSPIRPRQVELWGQLRKQVAKAREAAEEGGLPINVAAVQTDEALGLEGEDVVFSVPEGGHLQFEDGCVSHSPVLDGSGQVLRMERGVLFEVRPPTARNPSPDEPTPATPPELSFSFPAPIAGGVVSSEDERAATEPVHVHLPESHSPSTSPHVEGTLSTGGDRPPTEVQEIPETRASAPPVQHHQQPEPHPVMDSVAQRRRQPAVMQESPAEPPVATTPDHTPQHHGDHPMATVRLLHPPTEPALGTDTVRFLPTAERLAPRPALQGRQGESYRTSHAKPPSVPPDSAVLQEGELLEVVGRHLCRYKPRQLWRVQNGVLREVGGDTIAVASQTVMTIADVEACEGSLAMVLEQRDQAERAAEWLLEEMDCELVPLRYSLAAAEARCAVLEAEAGEAAVRLGEAEADLIEARGLAQRSEQAKEVLSEQLRESGEAVQ